VRFLWLLLIPSLATAQSLSEQAARQVELCREDFDAGVFERAVAACDSALRLEPTPEVQQQAFKWKGLAQLELGQLVDAQAMLLAYKSLRIGMPPDEQVDAALVRITDETPKPRTGPKPLPEQSVLPTAVAAGGGALAIGGFLLHGASWSQAQDSIDPTGALYFGAEESYTGLRGATGAGFALGLVGIGVAAGGSVWAALRAREADNAVAVVPWLSVGPDAVAFGVAGELP